MFNKLNILLVELHRPDVCIMHVLKKRQVSLTSLWFFNACFLVVLKHQPHYQAIHLSGSVVCRIPNFKFLALLSSEVDPDKWVNFIHHPILLSLSFIWHLSSNRIWIHPIYLVLCLPNRREISSHSQLHRLDGKERVISDDLWRLFQWLRGKQGCRWINKHLFPL